MLRALLLLASLVMTQIHADIDKIEITLADIVQEWYIVNDTVMGGRSRANLTWDEKEKFFQFTGRVSLENNGGFASVRGLFPDRLFSQAPKICIQVKGDGQDYQLRLRTNRYMDGVAYVQPFSTKKDEWQEISFNLDEFKPTWRGRQVRNYEPLKPEEIKQVTFMIANKQTGPFELNIKSVRPCTQTTDDEEFI